jgi:hypothetical protein
MGKKKPNKDELEKLLREILRELRSKRSLRRTYKLGPPLRSGGYPIRRNPYRMTSFKYQHQSKTPQEYKPRVERPSYGGMIRRRPEIYKPKERIVYDPEVKQLLKDIREELRRTTSKPPEVEEKTELLQESYDETVDGLKYESSLVDEIKGRGYEQNEGIELDKAESSEDVENVLNEGESIGEVLDLDELGEVTVEEPEPLEAIEPKSINDVLEVEPIGEDEVEFVGEYNSEIVEQIEAQDLSSLEVELYGPELASEVEVVENVGEGEVYG